MTHHRRPEIPAPPTVGILGAGRAGTALARALQRSDTPVRIASTRSPAAMRFHLAQYAPQATAVPAEQIAEGADVVVLMVPQEDLDSVDPDWLRGALLVDATNRWEDEPLPDWFQQQLADGRSSSEAVAARFPHSTVVKTLNHLSHWDLEGGGQRVQPTLQPVSGAAAPDQPHPPEIAPGATPPPHQRRALGIAADDGPAASRVAHLIETLGFDPVALPSLRAGAVLEPGGPVFNRSWTARQLRALVGDLAHPASADDGAASDR